MSFVRLLAQPGELARARLYRLAPVLPICAGAGSILLSWQQWINPFVDAPREMVVPARLAAGERLYRDVMYHYGPAAPWWNSAALKLFGRHFAVLEIVGLAFSILLFWSLFRLTQRAGSRLAAACGTGLAAALCLGAPNGGAFLFPYAFDSLFALAGGFFALERISARGSPLATGIGSAAGLALALAAKPEVGVATVIVLLASAGRSAERRRDGKRQGAVVLGALVLAMAAYAVAFHGLTWEIRCCEGPLTLFSPPQEWRNVYRVISGFADPAGSLNRLATSLFLGLVLLGGLALFARRKTADRKPPFSGEAAWYALLAAAVVFFASGQGGAIEDRLPPLLMPMPLVALVAAAFELRAPLSGPSRDRFLLFAFSGVFASRVVLGLAYGAYTTPYSILALPGLCASAAVLVLDRLSVRFPNPQAYRRGAAGLFVVLAVVGILRLERLRPRSATERVETAAGSLRLRPDKGVAVRETLAFLTARAHSGDRLVGFPEAGFFHFVTGLANPLRQDSIYPGMLDAPGEERVIRRLEERPPRFVLLINQPAPAFGAGSFGKDYGVRIWSAVQRAYLPVAAFGNADPGAPIGEGPFFIRIYALRREVVTLRD